MKNRVRLAWPEPRTSPRKVEHRDGVPVNPITGEVDVLAALKSGLSRDTILAAVEGQFPSR